MKNYHRFLCLVPLIIFALGALTACASKPVSAIQQSDNPQVAAIKNIRLAFGLPDLLLESRGTEHMINSPSGDLPVAIYLDSQGRKYSVEPQTNTVVEMDARDLLALIPANAPTLSQIELRVKTNQMLAVALPDFAALSQNLTYEDGGKIDNYFFNWYGKMSAGDFNRPFIQVGVYKTGFIFAYYNTVTIEQ